MASIKNIQAFREAWGVKSILNTKPPKIHGVNPTLTYEPSGKSFDLPRFSSEEMQMARIMNKIAIKNSYITRSKIVLRSNKAVPEDLKRLESTDVEDTYKRAFWINPKDNKGYHLLDEGRTQNGFQKLRILDEEGVFVKNAEIKPQTIIITDTDRNVKSLCFDNGGYLTHTDIIHMCAKRYNPFAKYKTILLETKDDNTITKYLNKLKNTIDNNTFGVSTSVGMYDHDIKIKNKIPGKEQARQFKNKFVNHNKNEEEYSLLENTINKLSSKVRFFFTAGNVGPQKLNAFLLPKGSEGVGGLKLFGKISKHSASRNSLFTQHYENMNSSVTTTKQGINITELHGTDFKIQHDEPVGRHLEHLSGTSFSTPIRVAKLALNKMMEGVL